MALVIQYNNKEIALEEGKSVVLLCTGKEMIENIKVFADNAVQTPTTSLNEYGTTIIGHNTISMANESGVTMIFE
jgi:hypothetical protein